LEETKEFILEQSEKNFLRQTQLKSAINQNTNLQILELNTIVQKEMTKIKQKSLDTLLCQKIIEMKSKPLEQFKNQYLK
jgi:hypothetical protein